MENAAQSTGFGAVPKTKGPANTVTSGSQVRLGVGGVEKPETAAQPTAQQSVPAGLGAAPQKTAPVAPEKPATPVRQDATSISGQKPIDTNDKIAEEAANFNPENIEGLQLKLGVTNALNKQREAANKSSLDTYAAESQDAERKSVAADRGVGLALEERRVGAQTALQSAQAEHLRSTDLSGDLSLPQQRTNAEIDAARQYVAGLSQDEIMRRTQTYTATGRDNPDYDPMLAERVRLANRRKYGEDDSYPLNPAPVRPQGDGGQPDDVQERFSSDQAMKGNRLGANTPQGREVFDAGGKLIGYWN